MATVTLSCLHAAETDSQSPSSTSTGSCDCGYYSSGPKVNNAWFDFDSIIAAIPAGATITAATLKLYQVSGGYSASQSLSINLASGSWWTPTWNSHPAIVTAAGTISTSLSGSSAGTRSFSIKSLVQYAVDNRGTSCHVIRVARNPNSTGGTNDAKRFSTTEANHSIVVTYTSGSSITVVVDGIAPVLTIQVPTVTTVNGGSKTVDVTCKALTSALKAVTVTTTKSSTNTVSSPLTTSLVFNGARLDGVTGKTIDGFLVYLHQYEYVEGQAEATYQFFTAGVLQDPGNVQIHVVPGNIRQFRFPNLAVDKYYHFMVRSYRVVDQNIDTTGILYSPSTMGQYPTNNKGVVTSRVPTFNGPFRPVTTDIDYSFAGLYANGQKMGYIDHGTFKAYIDYLGNFQLGDPLTGASFTWDQASSRLSIVVDDDDGGLTLNKGAIRTDVITTYADTLESPNGFWLGQDSDDHIYKFYIGGTSLDEFGNVVENFIRWDGDSLHIRGELEGAWSSEKNGTELKESTGLTIKTSEAMSSEEVLSFEYVGQEAGAIYSGMSGEEYELIVAGWWRTKILAFNTIVLESHGGIVVDLDYWGMGSNELVIQTNGGDVPSPLLTMSANNGAAFSCDVSADNISAAATDYSGTITLAGGTITNKVVNTAKWWKIGALLYYMVDISWTAAASPTVMTFSLPEAYVNHVAGVGFCSIAGAAEKTAYTSVGVPASGTIYFHDRLDTAFSGACRLYAQGFVSLA